jgi:pyridinium-3,5-biscarboxylic acid mononucleotide sulfurtransferase
MNLKEKSNNLQSIILKYEKIAIAYSGGIDSTLLLKICFNLKKDKATALIVKSLFLLNQDFNDAVDFCKTNNIKYNIINVDDNFYKDFSDNPEDRCYHCKKIVFSSIIKKAEEFGIKTIFDGSNASDKGDYRPGKRAIKELNIISPFVEADITKDEIRQLAMNEKIVIWNKPSNSCLATRIPYGRIITKEKLKQIELGENILHQKGFKIVRLRHFDDAAIIEVGKDERTKMFDVNILDEIDKEIKKIGFSYVTFNISGYESGNLNKIIDSLKQDKEISYG